jgi:hypothetical protein
MLKWLRKYNSWILAIGGGLLMIAFLLPQTLQELGRSNFGRPIFKFDGGRVGPERYQQADIERGILASLLRVDVSPQFRPFIGDNVEHWIMMTSEAEAAGLIGGPDDGKAALELVAGEVATMSARFMGGDLAALTKQVLTTLQASVPTIAGNTKKTDDQVYQILAKVHGVLRLRASYLGAPRFSDRRLLSEARRVADTTRVQYVVFPAERYMLGINPTDTEIDAHFASFRDIQPGSGVHGFGYSQPARVKLSWLTIERASIRQVVQPDAVEVQKRFLRAFPSVPEGTVESSEREKIANQLRDELTDQIMRTADQAVRGEIDKATRGLELDGAYRKLPDTFKPIDWVAIGKVIESRVLELHRTKIAVPLARLESSRWLNEQSLASLPGIGGAGIRSAQRTEPFATVALGVREIAGVNLSALQVGIPLSTPLIDASGNHYFFNILDARKPSAPDSIDEVRAQVVSDLKRLGGFDRLRSELEPLRTRAATEGIDALAAADLNFDGPAGAALAVRSAGFDQTRVVPSDPAVDTPEVRDAIAAVARRIDPLADIEKTPAADRTLVVPLPKQLGVFVARVTGVSPMTLETFRSQQGRFVRSGQGEEFRALKAEDDPYNFLTLARRLKLDHSDKTFQKSIDNPESAPSDATPSAAN